MLTDQQVRHLTIKLLTMPTARDKQTRVGASNLSNGCNYCLACNFLGDDRATPITDRAYLGRTWGTAQHLLLEEKINLALTHEGLDGIALDVARTMVETLIGLHPDAAPERRVVVCEIPGYGEVPGTIDLDLGPDEDHLLDWKGSTRKKLALLIDYMASAQGLEPIFGRNAKYTQVYSKNPKSGLYRKSIDGLSEHQYADEMESMAYKMNGYYGQQTLYMRGSGRHRASIVFLNRDGTGVFDNPTDARYEDPKAMRDVHVVSFDYDEGYAEALIARATAIWQHLETGGTPTDFDRHALCYPCGQEQKEAQKAPADIDIEVTFPIAS